MELLGLALVLVMALGIVIVLTRGIFSRDLTQALKRVNQQEQALQEKANILEQRLTQMEREYQTKLKRAEAEADRMLQDAKSQAMNIRTAAIEEAKHRARQLLLEAEQGKTQLKFEIAKELDGKTVQRVCESLRALLPTAELSSLHRTLMEELLAALQRLDVTSFRSEVQQIQMTIAQPLSPAQSEQFAQWATHTVGGDVPMCVEVDATLVAGGVVQVGPSIIDNSLPSRLHPR